MQRVTLAAGGIDPGNGKIQYQDANLAAGVNGTDIIAACMNALQEEVSGFIEGKGGTLNPALNSQLASTLDASYLVLSSHNSAGAWIKLPTGLIMQFGLGNTVTGDQDLVTFPVAFPNFVLGTPIINERNAAGWTGSCSVSVYGATTNNLSSFLISAGRWSGSTFVYDAGASYSYYVLGG